MKGMRMRRGRCLRPTRSSTARDHNAASGELANKSQRTPLDFQPISKNISKVDVVFWIRFSTGNQAYEHTKPLGKIQRYSRAQFFKKINVDWILKIAEGFTQYEISLRDGAPISYCVNPSVILRMRSTHKKKNLEYR